MAVQKSGKSATKENEVKLEILEECGIIGERETKYGKDTIKLRYLSWNDREPRYDIRPWYIDEDGNERAKKPTGLTGEELLALRDLINKLDSE